MSHIEYSFAVNLMQFLVVPTFVLDAEGRVIIWNKACERLSGLAAADVVGTKDHWKGFYAEPRPCLSDLFIENRTDEMADLYAAHDAAISLKHGIHAENWCVMPQSGISKYLAIDAGPILDTEGRLLAVVETLRDMTALKQAQTELERIAVQDGLTGITNRRGLDDRLAVEWKRVIRDKKSLALLMVDVDYFKSYNDTYGHPAGDACLKQVAQALMGQTLRPADLVARYGGEEFVVVLPDITREGALAVARRIHEAIADLGLPHESNEVSDQVTVSIGVAHRSPEAGDPLTDLLIGADESLYAAKNGGRNQIRMVRSTAAAER